MARGTTRVLHCEADGNPSPHTIVWFKNDRKFDPSVHLTSVKDETTNQQKAFPLSRISRSNRSASPPGRRGKSRHRIFQALDGSLYFHPVQGSDEGNYSCTPYSSLGAGKASHPFYLRVAGNQWFQSHYGRLVSLSC